MQILIKLLLCSLFTYLILWLINAVYKIRNPYPSVSSKKVVKKSVEESEEEMVYVDDEGFIILDWEKMPSEILQKYHRIPKSEVYDFQHKYSLN